MNTYIASIPIIDIKRPLGAQLFIFSETIEAPASFHHNQEDENGMVYKLILMPKANFDYHYTIVAILISFGYPIQGEWVSRSGTVEKFKHGHLAGHGIAAVSAMWIVRDQKDASVECVLRANEQ